MKLGNYKAAEKDCDRALELNPDSAKALKTRGKLRYLHLNDWHGALKDLSEAQSIDFDPDLVETLKELTKMRVEEEKNQAKERIDKENKMRKRAEEIRKAQEDEARDQKYHQKFKEQEAGSAFDMDGGMPGGGMPGMDMSGLMGLFMGDPEIQEAMKNPKVVAAFSELMSSPGGPASLLSDPAKVQKLMSDPEVGPVLQKILGKLGGAMPGGMGGMPGSSTGGGNDDDIPDLGNLPDLD
jgi:suppressor of tumorigenicity protein 13